MIDNLNDPTTFNTLSDDTFLSGTEGDVVFARPEPRDVIVTQFSVSVMTGGQEEKAFLATLAIDGDTRHIMGVDLLEGASFLDGQLNCRSKMVTEYNVGPLVSTQYRRGGASLRIYCDMTAAARFVALAQEHGDEIADMSGCDIQFVGCVERYRLHAQHLITTNAHMPAEELNRLLLNELRGFWYARWGFDKIPDYFQRRIKIAAAMERAAAQCSALARKIAIQRRADRAAWGPTATRDALRAFLERSSGYRKRAAKRMSKDVVFINPFHDRSVFLLVEGGNAHVEVKRGAKVTIPLAATTQLGEGADKRGPQQVTIRVPVAPDDEYGSERKPSKKTRRNLLRGLQAVNAI